MLYCLAHMIQYESAVGVTYAWVYFLLVVIVGSVFILNLWIGVLTRYFSVEMMMPSHNIEEA